MFYGYIMIVVLWLTYFVNLTMFLYGASVLNSKMIAAAGLNSSIVGIAVSLCTAMQGVSGPILGMLIIKKGVRVPMIIGTALLLSGAFLIAFLTKNEIFFVVFYGLIVGTGMGFSGILATQSAVNCWFHEKKAMAMALVLSAGGIGGFIAPLILNAVAERYSWQAGWVLIGVLSCASLAICLLFVVSRPADLGDVPDGKNRKPGTGNGQEGLHRESFAMPMQKVYRSPAFYGTMICTATRNVLYYSITGHLVIYLVKTGIHSGAAALCISIISISSLIGRLGVGFISESVLKPRTNATISNLLMGIGALIINTMPPVGAIYVCAALIGLGLGMGYIATPMVIARYFGSENFPMISGITTPVNFIFGGVGPLAAGFLATATGSYALAFAALSIVSITGGLIFFAIKPPAYCLNDQNPAEL